MAVTEKSKITERARASRVWKCVELHDEQVEGGQKAAGNAIYVPDTHASVKTLTRVRARGCRLLWKGMWAERRRVAERLLTTDPQVSTPCLCKLKTASCACAGRARR